MSDHHLADPRRRIARRRLAAQRLTGAGAGSPTEAVRWMLAMQGQDYAGAKWSVGLRCGATEAEVEAALDAGGIVRSWPLRGTLHLVAAEDLSWLLELTAVRSLASAGKRRDVLGITLDEIDRARELTVEALPGRTTLTRAALLAAIAAGGVSTAGQRGYHLLWYLAQTGTLVLGPTHGREQTFARLEAWVPSPRRLDRDEALGELAGRFFASHGPAVTEDLARWSGLPLRDVRRGVAVAGGALATVAIDGLAMLVAAEAADAVAVETAEAGVRLLPGFDEYVLGYRDRSAVLAREHADAIVPGGNGMFKATIVVDGEVVGTWRRSVRARETALAVHPFRPLDAGALDALAVEAERYGRYLGRRVRVEDADDGSSRLERG